MSEISQLATTTAKGALARHVGQFRVERSATQQVRWPLCLWRTRPLASIRPTGRPADLSGHGRYLSVMWADPDTVGWSPAVPCVGTFDHAFPVIALGAGDITTS